VTQTGDLGKDKPDPVTGLPSGADFSKDCIVGWRLGSEKALEIVSGAS
jgi:hypothetical protein